MLLRTQRMRAWPPHLHASPSTRATLRPADQRRIPNRPFAAPEAPAVLKLNPVLGAAPNNDGADDAPNPPIFAAGCDCSTLRQGSHTDERTAQESRSVWSGCCGACKGAGWGGGRSYLWSSKTEATACATECSGCAQRAKRGRRRSLPEHPAGCGRSELRGRRTERRRCRRTEHTTPTGGGCSAEKTACRRRCRSKGGGGGGAKG